MPLPLSLALTARTNPRSWPILDNRVKPEGIELLLSRVSAADLFWRQLKSAEFDVSEISLSSLLIAVSQGDDRYVGLPVFTTRRVYHTGIMVRRAAQIRSPADLRGKRVGVPEYQQTAALWARGALEEEFFVRPSEMEFWMERGPEYSHGAATGFKPPPGVTIHFIPGDKSIGSMMLAGELDATLFYATGGEGINRSKSDITRHPDIAYLFPDRAAEGNRYWTKTGLYPINHTMMIRRTLLEQHPWIARTLLLAFVEAAAIADRERLVQVEYHLDLGLLSPEAGDALRLPLVRHGIAANRLVLETAARLSHAQGLTKRVIKLEEVFAASVLDS